MAKTLDPNPPHDLQARLNRLLPDIRLLATPLPLVPEIRLWLLDELVDERLDQEVANALMEAPPYWSLCWASGQVLARHLLADPQWVRGKTVLDVGPGSGVVAIAAALAGAARVIACDLDPDALAATAANAIAAAHQDAQLLFGFVDDFIKLGDLWFVARAASAIAITISIRARTVVIVTIIASAPPGAAIISSH